MQICSSSQSIILPEYYNRSRESLVGVQMLCTCAHTAISTVQMHKRADTDFVHGFFFMGHTKGTHVLIITSEDFHGETDERWVFTHVRLI